MATEWDKHLSQSAAEMWGANTVIHRPALQQDRTKGEKKKEKQQTHFCIVLEEAEKTTIY